MPTRRLEELTIGSRRIWCSLISLAASATESSSNAYVIAWVMISQTFVVGALPVYVDVPEAAKFSQYDTTNGTTDSNFGANVEVAV